MNNITYSLIISLLAGLSTLIGIAVSFFSSRNKNKIIGISLSFSSGVMFCISILDLLPTSFDYISNIYSFFPAVFIMACYFLLGVILANFISHIIPDNNYHDKNLFKTGVFAMIILILHNIPEGIITFMSSSFNMKLGLSISMSVALHNIPEGISIYVPLYYSTGSRKKAFFYTFISGFSEFLGAVLAYLFLYRYVSDYLFCFLFSITAGIMVFISLCEMLPTANIYLKKWAIAICFFIGMLLMVTSHYLI